jgi:hypothetical protein
MKKLSKRMIAVITLFAATMMNPVNSYSNVKIDTLKTAVEDGKIGPDSEDALVEESKLELEDWMFEPVAVSSEEVLKVEDWMKEEISFDVEEKLEIEDWMNTSIESVKEEELKIEDWMSGKIETAGEEKLEIEDWMSDSDYFRK